MRSERNDTTEEAGIIVRGLGKRYRNGRQVLADVHFTVRKGETVGIIGRNGAGKSTLLKILAGALEPTEGSVRMRGTCRAVLELGAAFHPDCTGRENLRLQADLWGISAGERQQFMEEALRFAGIGQAAEAPVRTYSTGMFVRLAFAAAVCSTPEILLVDEALSVGDAAFQKKCYARMREISEHTSLVLVSHDLHALTRFCSRILVMDSGRIVFDGPAREAVDVYYRILQAAERAENGLREVRTDDPVYGDRESGVPEESFLRPADPTCMSGEGRIRVRRYSYTVDGVPFAGSIREGQEVGVALEVLSETDTDLLIVGYQVRDRCGTEIFGETQVTSRAESPEDTKQRAPRRRIRRGTSLIRFCFRWPGVREGMYFLTPGIGIGEDVLRQKEQCWLNDAIRLDSSAGGRLIYGMFNVPMEAFRIAEVPARKGPADGKEQG